MAEKGERDGTLSSRECFGPAIPSLPATWPADAIGARLQDYLLSRRAGWSSIDRTVAERLRDLHVAVANTSESQTVDRNFDGQS